MIFVERDGKQEAIKIIGVKNSSWLLCEFANGNQEEIHRRYIKANKGIAEIEQAMDKVTDNNV